MSGLYDLSTNPNSNTSIDGVAISENCAPSGLNDAIRALAAYAKGAVLAVSASGTNSITASVSPDPDAYVTGMLVAFKAAGANTGATTFNLNSLGAKNFYKAGVSGPVALSGGEIQTGQFVVAYYDSSLDSSNGGFIMVSPVAGGVGAGSGISVSGTTVSLASYRGALVRKNANQSIANASATFLTWQTEDRDTDSIHDGSSNTSRLTVPSGVTKIRLRANVVFAANATGNRVLELLKNGGNMTPSPEAAVPACSGGATTRVGISSPVLDVTAGDYFEVRAFQDSNSAVNVTSSDATWFEMEIVR